MVHDPEPVGGPNITGLDQTLPGQAIRRPIAILQQLNRQK